MSKKTMSRIFFVVAIVSLVIGASFHGYRIHPEDVTKYNIGVVMGIAMISIFVISLIAGVTLAISSRKD